MTTIAKTNRTSKTERVLSVFGRPACMIYLSVLALLVTSPSARATDYNLEIVTQQGDTISGKILNSLGSAVISDSGHVAFLGRYTGGRGIFARNAALALEGNTIGGKILTGIFGVSAINNHGDVVFWARTQDGEGIFTQNEAIAVTGDSIDGKLLTGFGGGAAIKESGEVVFIGHFDGGSGIFTRKGAQVVTGDIVDGKKLLSLRGAVFANNSGDVVFAATFDDDGVIRTGIFTSDRLIAAEDEDIDGNTLILVTFSPAINEPGDVIHDGQFDDGNKILLGNTIFLESGDIIDGQVIENPASQSVNNGLTIAGGARVNGGALFSVITQDDIVAMPNDPIDGKTIRTPEGGSRINNGGQIVFNVRFNEGNTQGIILASPTED